MISPQNSIATNIMIQTAGETRLVCCRSFSQFPSITFLNWTKVATSVSLKLARRQSTNSPWLFSIILLDTNQSYIALNATGDIKLKSNLSCMFTPGKLTHGCLHIGQCRYAGDLFLLLFQRAARHSWQKLWPQ